MSAATPLDVVTKARASIVLDGLRTETKARPSFDEEQHPRDRKGRFIEKGAIVKILGGALGKVIANVGHGRIEVQRQSDGKDVIVHRNYLTVIKGPGDKAPDAKTPGAALPVAKPTPDAEPEGRLGENRAEARPQEDLDALDKATSAAVSALQDLKDPTATRHASEIERRAADLKRALSDGDDSNEADERAALSQAIQDAQTWMEEDRKGGVDGATARHLDAADAHLDKPPTAKPDAGSTEVTTSGLPPRYQIVSDRYGLTLKRDGKIIRTSSDRGALVKFAHEHAAEVEGGKDKPEPSKPDDGRAKPVQRFTAANGSVWTRYDNDTADVGGQRISMMGYEQALSQHVQLHEGEVEDLTPAKPAPAEPGPTNERGAQRLEIPAEQVQAGDYLDIAHRTRVHTVHTLPNGDIAIGWKRKGSRAPGVQQHKPGETVRVWRLPAKAERAAARDLPPGDRVSGVQRETYRGEKITVKHDPQRAGYLQVAINGHVIHTPIGRTNGDVVKHLDATRGTIDDAYDRPEAYTNSDGPLYGMKIPAPSPGAAAGKYDETVRKVTLEGTEFLLVHDPLRPYSGARSIGAYLDTPPYGRLEQGYLLWDSRGIVTDVGVRKPYQRQGLATAMWEFAKTFEPGLQHSHALTEDGQAWSQTVADGAKPNPAPKPAPEPTPAPKRKGKGNLTTVTHPDGSTSKRTSQRANYTHAVVWGRTRADRVAEAESTLSGEIQARDKTQAALDKGGLTEERRPWGSDTWVTENYGGLYVGAYVPDGLSPTSTMRDKPLSEAEARALIEAALARYNERVKVRQAAVERVKTEGPDVRYEVLRWSSRPDLAARAADREFAGLKRNGSTVTVHPVDATDAPPEPPEPTGDQPGPEPTPPPDTPAASPRFANVAAWQEYLRGHPAEAMGNNNSGRTQALDDLAGLPASRIRMSKGGRLAITSVAPGVWDVQGPGRALRLGNLAQFTTRRDAQAFADYLDAATPDVAWDGPDPVSDVQKTAPGGMNPGDYMVYLRAEFDRSRGLDATTSEWISGEADRARYQAEQAAAAAAPTPEPGPDATDEEVAAEEWDRNLRFALRDHRSPGFRTLNNGARYEATANGRRVSRGRYTTREDGSAWLAGSDAAVLAAYIAEHGERPGGAPRPETATPAAPTPPWTDTTMPVADLNAMDKANTKIEPDSPEMAALVEDIRANGVREPIHVEETNQGPLLTDGLHRLMAAQQAGLTEVPVRQFANTPEGRMAALRGLNAREQAKVPAPAPTPDVPTPATPAGGPFTSLDDLRTWLRSHPDVAMPDRMRGTPGRREGFLDELAALPDSKLALSQRGDLVVYSTQRGDWQVAPAGVMLTVPPPSTRRADALAYANALDQVVGRDGQLLDWTAPDIMDVLRAAAPEGVGAGEWILDVRAEVDRSRGLDATASTAVRDQENRIQYRAEQAARDKIRADGGYTEKIAQLTDLSVGDEVAFDYLVYAKGGYYTTWKTDDGEPVGLQRVVVTGTVAGPPTLVDRSRNNTTEGRDGVKYPLTGARFITEDGRTGDAPLSPTMEYRTTLARKPDPSGVGVQRLMRSAERTPGGGVRVTMTNGDVIAVDATGKYIPLASVPTNAANKNWRGLLASRDASNTIVTPEFLDGAIALAGDKVPDPPAPPAPTLSGFNVDKPEDYVDPLNALHAGLGDAWLGYQGTATYHEQGQTGDIDLQQAHEHLDALIEATLAEGPNTVATRALDDMRDEARQRTSDAGVTFHSMEYRQALAKYNAMTDHRLRAAGARYDSKLTQDTQDALTAALAARGYDDQGEPLPGSKIGLDGAVQATDTAAVDALLGQRVQWNDGRGETGDGILGRDGDGDLAVYQVSNPNRLEYSIPTETNGGWIAPLDITKDPDQVDTGDETDMTIPEIDKIASVLAGRLSAAFNDGQRPGDAAFDRDYRRYRTLLEDRDSADRAAERAALPEVLPPPDPNQGSLLDQSGAVDPAAVTPITIPTGDVTALTPDALTAERTANAQTLRDLYAGGARDGSPEFDRLRSRQQAIAEEQQARDLAALDVTTTDGRASNLAVGQRVLLPRADGTTDVHEIVDVQHRNGTVRLDVRDSQGAEQIVDLPDSASVPLVEGTGDAPLPAPADIESPASAEDHGNDPIRVADLAIGDQVLLGERPATITAIGEVDGEPLRVLTGRYPDGTTLTLPFGRDVTLDRVTPVDPIKIKDLPAGTAISRPALYTYQRRNIVALGLDHDPGQSVAVRQAAARLRARQPLSAAQSAALSDAVRGYTSRLPADTPRLGVKQRSLERVAWRLDAAEAQATGRPAPDLPGRAPTVTKPADLTVGDTVALAERTGVTTGRVVGVRAMMRGRVVQVDLEHTDGTVSTRLLTRDAETYLLADLPDSTPVLPAHLNERVRLEDLRVGDTIRWAPPPYRREPEREVTVKAVGTDEYGDLQITLDTPSGNNFAPGGATGDALLHANGNDAYAIRTARTPLSANQPAAGITQARTMHEKVSDGADLKVGDYVEVKYGAQDWRGWVLGTGARGSRTGVSLQIMPEGADHSQGVGLPDDLTGLPDDQGIWRLAEYDQGVTAAVQDIQAERRLESDAGLLLMPVYRVQNHVYELVDHVTQGHPSASNPDQYLEYMETNLRQRTQRNGALGGPANELGVQLANGLPDGAHLKAADAVRPILGQVYDQTTDDVLSALRNAHPLPGENRMDAMRRVAAMYRTDPPDVLDRPAVGMSLARYKRALASADPNARADDPGRTWEGPQVEALPDRMAAYRAQLGGGFGKEQRSVPTLGDVTLESLQAGKAPKVEFAEVYVDSVAADQGPGEEAMRHLAIVRAAGKDLDSRAQTHERDILGAEHSIVVPADVSAEQHLKNLDAQFAAAGEHFRAVNSDLTARNTAVRDEWLLNEHGMTFSALVAAIRAAKDNGNPGEEQRLLDILSARNQIQVLDDRRDEARVLNQQQTDLAAQAKALRTAIRGARREAALRALREAGIEIGGPGLTYHQVDKEDNRVKVRREKDVHVQAMRYAESSYPSTWLARLRAKWEPKGGIGTRDITRGHYQERTGVIALSADTIQTGVIGGSTSGPDDRGIPAQGSRGRVAVHELGHAMESVIPGLPAAEKALLWDRTSQGEIGSRTREAPTSIYEGKAEYGRRDEFPDHYTGKVYEGQDFHEVFTTQIESLLAGSRYGDADLREWTLGVLALLGHDDTVAPDAKPVYGGGGQAEATAPSAPGAPVKTTVTASSVSRVLSAARFTRSTSSGTRVRGYRDVTDGFKVSEPRGNSNLYGSVVWVEANVRTRAGSSNEDTTAAQATARRNLERYAESLRAKGYSAEMESLGYDNYRLVVRPAAEGTAP